MDVGTDPTGTADLSGRLVSGATIGALAGSALPIERVQGVDFALTALFVVLAIDAYRVRPVPFLAAGAAACAVLAWLAVPEQMLVWAFVGYTAIVIGRFVLARRGSTDV